MNEPLTKAAYGQHLADLNNPQLSLAWGIIDECYHAQQKKLTEINYNTPDSPPLTVPLAVITYLAGKYQWSFTADSLPNQMRRITKITLI